MPNRELPPISEEAIFWENLEKIKDSMDVNDQQFAAFLGLNYVQYLKKKEGNKFLPMGSVFELAERMNFHFESLMQEDFKLNPKLGANTYAPIPERYTVGAYSQVRPILNILDYLERNRGVRARLNLIRKLKVSEDFISSEKNSANVFLITDVVNCMRMHYGFNPQQFINMGQRTPFVTTNDFLKQKLTAPMNSQELIECFFSECTHLFDKNFTYKLDRVGLDEAIIEAKPNANVLEEVKVEREFFGNEHVCLTRMGVISSITWFKYKRNAEVKKIKSIHNGDSSNKYSFDLSPFKMLDSGRLLNFAH